MSGPEPSDELGQGQTVKGGLLSPALSSRGGEGAKPLGGAPTRQERILGGLWGALVGDALGVPVEFRNRAEVQQNPVVDMREFGTHNQPRGTWSDDGALLLCTVDSLLNAEFDTEDMGRRFVAWMQEAKWTATGVVFDIGGTTADALMKITSGSKAEDAGGCDEHNNGNGSLMRIIPVSLRFAGEPIASLSQLAERVSVITHGHGRSKLACAFYSLMIRYLLEEQEPSLALTSARKDFAALYGRSREFERFRSHLTEDFAALPEGMVVSSGYVLHTLHAALWCLLTTTNYRDCALKAVNLGGDTDTTGCVAGGLAGAAYGVQGIPPEWISQMQRRGDVDCLLRDFADLCNGK